MNTLTNLELYVSYSETGFGVMLLISQALGIPPICEVGNPLIRIEIGIKTSTITYIYAKYLACLKTLPNK